MMHVNIYVYGNVQGVGFRHSACNTARYLGIKGFVRNCVNGSVYIEAEGENQALSQFIQWCKKGSTFSEVENVEVEGGEMKNYSSFNARL
ncbi:MAG: acylphosphatase [Bacteroidota bacterium]|nr:acylphosphatase [Bacteroidota bacterium]MDP4225206.1 acylphosphatase [Bacteroidota bacterium]MDP4272855.1 acylphosphatase [Bacteroidota bacterium]